jgi:hypothetical protein
VDGLGGNKWHKVNFTGLPGKPMSYISEEMFKASFKLTFSALPERLGLACDRARYVDGHLVNVEGALQLVVCAFVVLLMHVSACSG